MCYLAFSGGRDFEIFGSTITSHEPRRPLLILALAVSALILSTGAVSRVKTPRRLRFIRIDDRLLVGGLAVGVLALGLRYGTMVAGGSDSYSYITQAESLRRGTLEIPQPWAEQVPWPLADRTFAPLGYVPSQDGRAIVPVVPPGLPMLMAGAALVGGHCAMFWAVPVSGAVLVLCTYGLGRRLGSSRVGLAASALVASSPVFLLYLPQPMSDVPVTAAWALAFFLLCSRSVASAGGAGLATAVAVLIRPNLSPLAVLLPAWLAMKAVRAGSSPERLRRVQQLAAYVTGLAPGVLLLALFNWHMFGSPLKSGYGDVQGLFSLSNVLPNARNYLTWFVEIETVLPLAGIAALILPRTAKWPRGTDPAFVVLLGTFVCLLFAEYCAYGVFDQWWYLRFLLPGWPFLMIGFAQLAGRLARASMVAATLVTLVVVALVVRGAWVGARERSFEVWRLEHRYVAIAHLVRDTTETNSVILSGQHSGALRHYGGRLTLNFSWLDPRWLDRTVVWLEAHGAHPYALLDEFEVAEFRQYFAGQKNLSLLEARPVLAHVGASTTRLFDLQSAPRTEPTISVKEVPYNGPRCLPPAPHPQLVLK